MKLAQNIDRARVAAKLTKTQLAVRCGVTQGAVSHWLSGTTGPKLSMLPKIAKALKTTVAELVG